MENSNDVKQIQGLEGFYVVNRAKEYMKIEEFEKFYLVQKDNKREVFNKDEKIN